MYRNIDAERVRKGLTLEALAAELGITRKTLLKYRQGGKIPQKVLCRMSELFECEESYLINVNNSEAKTND